MNAVALLLLLTAPAQDEEPTGPVVPLVGRPENFSGASGRFRIDMEADPEEFTVEESCALRVRITALGPVVAPPERLFLPESLLADFHVEELGMTAALDESARAATVFALAPFTPTPHGLLATAMPTRSWEFRYRLRPRRAGIDEVPGFEFCFHAPFLHTASRPFMTDYADLVPLKVTTQGSQFPPLPEGPDALFAWHAPPLVTRAPPALPSLLFALLALPVVGCVIWQRVWKRLYPDAARQATLRRSRAARRALADLGRLRAPLTRTSAGAASHVLARYLRERLDQPQAEPTPREVADHLRRLRITASNVETLHALMTALDEYRFLEPRADADLLAGLRAVILALEEEPCLSSP